MRRNVANRDIRERITKLGLFQWEVANLLGVSDITFSKWLRVDLSENDERRKRIDEVLKEKEYGESITI